VSVALFTHLRPDTCANADTNTTPFSRFEFAGHRSAVSCLEPAPVLDVVAVGHEDGCVVLQDLKQDSVAMKLSVIVICLHSFLSIRP
jgi:hypothetical protein